MTTEPLDRDSWRISVIALPFLKPTTGCLHVHLLSEYPHSQILPIMHACCVGLAAAVRESSTRGFRVQGRSQTIDRPDTELLLPVAVITLSFFYSFFLYIIFIDRQAFQTSSPVSDFSSIN